MNDFSVPYSQDQFLEELENEASDSRRISKGQTSVRDQRFNSVLDFMEIILEKSYGMFDKMLERLSGKKVVQLSACGFHTVRVFI